MKRIKFQSISAIFLFFLSGNSLYAFSVVDPTGSTEKGISLFTSISTIEYKWKDKTPDYCNEFNNDEDISTKGDTERKLVGFSFTAGLTDKVDLYEALGYVFDAELKDSEGSNSNHDHGYFGNFGARAQVFKIDAFSIHAYGQIQYLFDKFSWEEEAFPDNEKLTYDVDLESKQVEVCVGFAGRYNIGDRFSVYCGLEFIPYSDGKVETQGGTCLKSNGAEYAAWTDGKIDFERSDIWAAKLGATCKLVDALSVRGEVSVVSEEAYTISCQYQF